MGIAYGLTEEVWVLSGLKEVWILCGLAKEMWVFGLTKEVRVLDGLTKVITWSLIYKHALTIKKRNV